MLWLFMVPPVSVTWLSTAFPPTAEPPLTRPLILPLVTKTVFPVALPLVPSAKPPVT